MIPVAGAVRVGDYRVHGFRLSIPFFLLWIVLAPLLVLRSGRLARYSRFWPRCGERRCR
jgi:hypothetical protein